ISIVAALCAVNISGRVRDYLIPSHASAERGYAYAAKALGIRPLFDLDMRLGEGSGCPPAFALLRAACEVQRSMATFEEAGIDDGYLDEIRQGK
ncbi:MAG: nicotinate-nucleotide--dimethylbenzimidazole phosphoribosyltransferase, partial [Clostridia bacterium]|nr:nicotinate-nucleotide--dimethylbenzimidazole phosphoribosyltransferase [Clostridia bacterium]